MAITWRNMPNTTVREYRSDDNQWMIVSSYRRIGRWWKLYRYDQATATWQFHVSRDTLKGAKLAAETERMNAQ